MLNRPNAVHHIPYQGCKVAYVGETSRPLGKRTSKSIETGKNNDSAVAKHSMDTAHPIDWDSTSILDSAVILGKRLCEESTYITREPHAMNLIPGYPFLVFGI